MPSTVLPDWLRVWLPRRINSRPTLVSRLSQFPSFKESHQAKKNWEKTLVFGEKLFNSPICMVGAGQRAVLGTNSTCCTSSSPPLPPTRSDNLFMPQQFPRDVVLSASLLHAQSPLYQECFLSTCCSASKPQVKQHLLCKPFYNSLEKILLSCTSAHRVITPTFLIVIP